MFPIMLGHRPDVTAAEIRAAYGASMIVGLPWQMLAAHEAQAMKNHSQTVARLAERGGLSACEACAVLEDRPWRKMPTPEAHARLRELFTEYIVNEQGMRTSEG